MPVLNPQITEVGLDAALLASGISVELPMTHIGFLAGNGFTPDGTETEASISGFEVARVAINSGSKVDNANQIRMIANWDNDADQSPITGLAFYTTRAAVTTLFAVWSDPAYVNATPFAYKSLNVDFLAIYDLILVGVPTGVISILEDNGLGAALSLIADHLVDPEAHPQYLKRTNHILCEDVSIAANTIILTPEFGSEFTAPYNGQRLTFKAIEENTGATNVQITGIAGIFPLKKNNSALIAKDILENIYYDIIFDDNEWHVQSYVLAPATVSRAGRVQLATNVEADAATDTVKVITPSNLNSYKTRIANLESSIGTSFTVDFYSDNTAGYPATTFLVGSGLLTSMNVGESVFVKDASSAPHGTPLVVGGDPSITYEPAWAVYRKISVGNVLGTNIVKVSEQGEFGLSIGQATETEAGVAEIATEAEVDAGTDDEKIITPLKLEQRLYKKVHPASYELDFEAVPTPTQIFTLRNLNAINERVFNVLENSNGLVKLGKSDPNLDNSPIIKHYYYFSPNTSYTDVEFYIGYALLSNINPTPFIIITNIDGLSYDSILYRVVCSFDIDITGLILSNLVVKTLDDFRGALLPVKELSYFRFNWTTTSLAPLPPDSSEHFTWDQLSSAVEASTAEIIYIALIGSTGQQLIVGNNKAVMEVPKTCKYFILDLNNHDLVRTDNSNSLPPAKILISNGCHALIDAGDPLYGSVGRILMENQENILTPTHDSEFLSINNSIVRMRSIDVFTQNLGSFTRGSAPFMYLNNSILTLDGTCTFQNNGTTELSYIIDSLETSFVEFNDSDFPDIYWSIEAP